MLVFIGVSEMQGFDVFDISGKNVSKISIAVAGAVAWENERLSTSPVIMSRCTGRTSSSRGM